METGSQGCVPVLFCFNRLTLICVNHALYLPATSRIIPIFEPNNQNEKTA